MKRSLNEDEAENYKIRIQAADGDNPPRTSTEIVTVRVNRNLNTPVFTKPDGEGATATITIKEDENFQKVLYRVEARDADRRVRNRLIASVVYLSSEIIKWQCTYFFPHIAGLNWQ